MFTINPAGIVIAATIACVLWIIYKVFFTSSEDEVANV